MKLPYKSGTVRVTSPFGWRTLGGIREYHNGIDLVGSDKTLVSPVDGTIRSSMIVTDSTNRTSEWGNYVRIDTDDGLQVFLCHMESRKVKVGDRVKVGDVIGVEGSTGKSTGSHCHFEVRKNGVSVNPCLYLGIANAAGVHTVNAAKTYSDTYEHDGLTFVRCKNFALKYHDLGKRSGNYTSYINGGFFAYYAEDGVDFTLPVANLVCDINKSKLSEPALKYLSAYIKGDKLWYGCNNNQSDQFRNKRVSTLVVPSSGKPYVSDMVSPPANCKYAISGVPTVRNGDDVDYYGYVKSQGWDDSCMYATWRSWLGVRDGEIWLISGKTTKKNYIYGMEFWKKVSAEGFDDIICLDGGGSYYRKLNGKVQATAGTRAVNNVVVI